MTSMAPVHQSQPVHIGELDEGDAFVRECVIPALTGVTLCVGSYPFTAPAVIPATIWRLKNR